MQWFLERGRWPFLAVLAGVTLFLAFHCLHLTVDQDNRSMDADQPAQQAAEADFRRAFGGNDSLVVAVSRAEPPDDKHRELVSRLVRTFEALDGVRRVDSLADTGGAVAPWQRGVMVSEDGNTTAIRLVLDEFTDNGGKLAHIVETVKSVAAQHTAGGTRVAVTGLPVQKYELGRLVRRDQRMFAPLSMLVLGAVLFCVTRRISGVVFPLLVSALTICWTLGLYALSGHSLNMITSLLPPVIMTLSVATTIHIYFEWLGSPEHDARTRISAAVKCLYRPCLFASLTTAVGFLSLLLSPTPAVRHFGVFAAVGVLIAYLLGVFGLAAGLTFLTPPRTDRLHASHGWAWLDRFLQGAANLSINHPWRVILVVLGIAAAGVPGFLMVESDTNLLDFLGSDSPLAEDTRFIDDRLAGVSTIELLVERADGGVIESLEPIAAFQQDLGGIEHVRQSLSIADLLPQHALALQRAGVPLAAILADFGGNAYLSGDLRKLRVTVSTGRIGTRRGSVLVGRIAALAETRLGRDFTVRPVGGFYRVIVGSSQLVASQLKSFGVAIALILLAIGVVFRSWRYTALAVVPNVVPLLVTAAVMGYAGITLSTGTVMIASVVIGIAVDDTIHYLSSYRRTVRRDRLEAISYTTRSTGFVLLATTMALSAGFWVAVFGSFQPTIHFALLSGVTMWIALACDLLVLPAFLRIASPSEPNHRTIDS